MTGPTGSLPMGARPVDDKPSDTLVVVSGDGFWTGSSTLPHLHHLIPLCPWIPLPMVAAGELTWVVFNGGLLLPFVPLAGILAATYLVLSSTIVVSVTRRAD